MIERLTIAVFMIPSHSVVRNFLGGIWMSSNPTLRYLDEFESKMNALNFVGSEQKLLKNGTRYRD
jgi:hypothetical protein